MKECVQKREPRICKKVRTSQFMELEGDAVLVDTQ